VAVAAVPDPAPAAAEALPRVALITDGHGWASRAVVSSLGRAGWRVLAPAGTKSCRSRFCEAAVRLPDPCADIRGFTGAVSETIRRHGVGLVVPGEDASLELVYETVGLLGRARVLGGDRESARLAIDKSRTLAEAAAAGFGTPVCAEPHTVAEAVAAGREIGFPCVVKPRRSYARAGNAMRGARLAFAADQRELRRSVEAYLAIGFEMPLVQQWVPGRSIGVAAVLRSGRVLAWGAREAFSQCPIRGGSAVWRATVGAGEPGVREALELLRSLGFEGLGDVQYHIDSGGAPRLMEIGARTYGWLPLTIAAGADLPLIAARALEGEEPADTIVARPGLHMRWPRGELARIGEALTPGVQLPPGATRRDVLRQLRPLRGDEMRFDGWGAGDRRLRIRWRRRRASSLSAEVVPGLARVDAGEWDALVHRGGGGLRHGFLRAWERAELPGLASRPLVVREPGTGRLLAAAPAYRYVLDMAAVQHSAVPGVVDLVRSRWPRFLTTPVYEIGAPAARMDPLLHAPGTDPEQAADAIVGAAVREAERLRVGMIVVQDFVAPGGPLARALRGSGFSSVRSLPTVVVSLGFATFEDYLAAMRSKYRRRTRCILEGSAHLRVERIEDFAPLAGELARLWRCVYDRATETKREVLGEAFFEAAAVLPELSALVLRRPDGSIAVFGLLLEDRPWLHFLQCGFEAEAGRGESAYFRLLVEIVRAGIEGGFDFAHLGCTTVGPKLDVGGEAVALGAWIRHRNPLIQRVFAFGGNGRFAPAPPTARHVFR